jgi:hypothetical protein
MLLLGPEGDAAWERAEDFASNRILNCFAIDGEMDAVETIARAYVASGRH